MSNESNHLQEISTAILEIKNDIERIAEKQDEMILDVKEVKKAIYSPDSGLYARLRALEQWKDSTSKVMWVIITTVVGLLTTTFYQGFLS